MPIRFNIQDMVSKTRIHLLKKQVEDEEYCYLKAIRVEDKNKASNSLRKLFEDIEILK